MNSPTGLAADVGGPRAQAPPQIQGQQGPEKRTAGNGAGHGEGAWLPPQEEEWAGLAKIRVGKVYCGPWGGDEDLMRLYDWGKIFVQQINDYSGHQQTARRVRAAPSAAGMQGPNLGILLVQMEEIGQLREE